MDMNRKQIVIAMVGLALLAWGVGFASGRIGLQQALGQVKASDAAVRTLEARLTAERQTTAALQEELQTLKAQQQLIVPLDSSVADRIRRSGGPDPAALLDDLRGTPAVIPAEAVLGGTMAFTRVGLIDEHWVYGAYEDGHIAGAAIFQWEIRDSSIIWTPILVLDE